MTTPRLARLTSDWIAVREIQQTHTGPIIQLENPNKTHGSVITGIVEQVGPGKRYKGGLVVPVALQVGQLVYFEVEMGRARLPWDLDVRIMHETDVAGVVDPKVTRDGLPIRRYKGGMSVGVDPLGGTVRPEVAKWVNDSLEEMGYPRISPEQYKRKINCTFPHPDDLSDAERDRIIAQNRLAPVRER